jgi:hypothetical protein
MNNSRAATASTSAEGIPAGQKTDSWYVMSASLISCLHLLAALTVSLCQRKSVHTHRESPIPPSPRSWMLSDSCRPFESCTDPASNFTKTTVPRRIQRELYRQIEAMPGSRCRLQNCRCSAQQADAHRRFPCTQKSAATPKPNRPLICGKVCMTYF